MDKPIRAGRAGPFAAARRTMLSTRGLVAILVLLSVFTWGDFGVRVLLPALHAPHWPDPAYWVAARLAEEGHASRIYAGDQVFFQETARMGTVRDIFDANMPSTLLPFLPFGVLNEASARDIWDLLMLACYVVAFFIVVRMLRLAPLVGLALWALLPIFHPWRENISRGQVYPLLLVLLVTAAAFETTIAGRTGKPGDGTGRAEVISGLALGALAVVKLYYGAILLLPALVARRGRLLAVALGTFAVAAGVTLFLWGGDLWARATGFSLAWRDRPETAVTAYQTLNSFLAHLFRHDPTWNPGPVADLPGLATSLWWGAALALGGATMLAMWTAQKNRPATPARALLVLALAVPLALLLAPVAEDYHFILTLFPLLVAGVALWEMYGPRANAPGAWRSTRVSLVSCLYGAAWLAAVLLLGAPWRFNVPGVTGWHSLLYYPRLYGTLLLWALIMALIVSARRLPASVESADTECAPAISPGRAKS